MNAKKVIDLEPLDLMSEVTSRDQQMDNAVEKAYRRGVAQALNMAFDTPELRTAEACDLAMEMRYDLETYPMFSLHDLIKAVRVQNERSTD